MLKVLTMKHPHLPYTLIIAAGNNIPMATIPVRDLADASSAYQDFRMRNAPTTCPPGKVTIGAATFDVAEDGRVMYGNFTALEPQ